MAIDYNKKPEQNAGGVNLSKINLTKESPTVSLSKAGSGQGVTRVNLNWSRGEQKKGFLAKLTGASGGVDLDLGCLFELADGSKGVIQALGNSFGALNTPPYIHLDGDDRTGSNTGGENMSVNLERPELFKRVLIFAMIYEGAPNWAAGGRRRHPDPAVGAADRGASGLAEQRRADLRDRDAAEHRAGHHRRASRAVHRRQPVRPRPRVRVGHAVQAGRK